MNAYERQGQEYIYSRGPGVYFYKILHVSIHRIKNSDFAILAEYTNLVN